ncbi:NAD(P)/FAD-dependent oxidoreductase [Polycladidibacter hongkongensis]|uniref:NAD(P)/FAD-dependent oxidoreductase n=1 Tax=Polycladidibacter hongkongensis TaxID=1647556 RepID=UPI00082FEFFE|nr:FAD-dependent oxidoreductase [Pseudovibrio hongkongensis]
MKCDEHVVVLGAGIIGVSCALQLLREGYHVTLIDRSGVAQGASKGNAGAFAFADIEPLATPGIMRKAPKWLLDPLGPLSLPPRYFPKILPWLLRFWRASLPDRYGAAVAAQSAMMGFCQAALERQIAQVDGEGMMQREGQLQLFEGERQFRASMPAWELKRQHGIAFHLLSSPEAIAEIQSGIDPRFTHAGFTPAWMNVCEPAKWAERIYSAAVALGARFIQDEMRQVALQENGVQLVCAGQQVVADRVVVAGGAWSHHVARMLGERIPLETERGYNTTLPPGAFDVKTQLTFGGHGFVVSRIGGGVRVGGAVELGGLDLPPNFQRSKVLLNKAKQFLPGLDCSQGQEWMGFRPSLPDSLPVIDYAKASKRVCYAFGHGHLGLTQSAGTAELVADLVAQRPAKVSIDAFRADRF